MWMYLDCSSRVIDKLAQISELLQLRGEETEAALLPLPSVQSLQQEVVDMDWSGEC